MNIKKTVLSLFTIGVVATLALVSTKAFFNDTETSTGNILQAGALDLKIDNTCYYNGNACIPNEESETGHAWSGGLLDGQPCSCTWQSKDLGQGDVFFNLTDLKPGDYEEDTISVNVDNPSWLCADINVTKDDDNTCTEPENAAIGGENGACAPGQPGELAQNLYFVFWKDDGDNVFEQSEANSILTEGTADAVLGNVKWALADSSTGRVPIPAKTTTYIGKFFCFGTLTKTPLADGEGNPVVRQGSGFTCNGTAVDNKSQTDQLMGDITFYAEQARHNDNFLCSERTTQRPTVGALLSSYVAPSTCNVTVDDNGGNTALDTIQEGVNAATAGQTVCVKAGTYTEDVNVNKSITLAGDGPTLVTLTGVGTGEAGAMVVTADNVTVKGFKVVGTGVSALRISNPRTGVTFSFNDAVAASGQNALLMDGGQSNHTVSNNVFEGASSQLVYVNGLASVNVASTNVDFLNNTFAGSGNEALGQEAGASDIKWNKFSTVTSFTDVEDWEGGNAYNFNNFNDTGLNLQHSENGNTGDNGITNAENNWWGDNNPADGDVNANVDVDFTPFEASAFPEN